LKQLKLPKFLRIWGLQSAFNALSIYTVVLLYDSGASSGHPVRQAQYNETEQLAESNYGPQQDEGTGCCTEPD